MPKMTRKQRDAEARCKDCDKGLGRKRSDPGFGPWECCCANGFCTACCIVDLAGQVEPDGQSMDRIT